MLAIVLTYHDSLPPPQKRKTYSKYDLVIRKFLLSRRPVASTKAPSEKQAATMASSFRRSAKDNAYPIRVVKRGHEIYLINLKMEGGTGNDNAH